MQAQDFCKQMHAQQQMHYFQRGGGMGGGDDEANDEAKHVFMGEHMR